MDNETLVFKLYAGHFRKIQLWHYVVQSDYGTFYKTDIDLEEITTEFLADIAQSGREFYRIENDLNQASISIENNKLKIKIEKGYKWK